MKTALVHGSTTLALGEKQWRQRFLESQFLQVVQSGAACFWFQHGLQEDLLNQALEITNLADRWGDVRLLATGDGKEGVQYYPFWARTEAQLAKLFEILGIIQNSDKADLYKQLPALWQQTQLSGGLSLEKVFLRHEVAILPLLNRAEADVMLADITVTLDQITHSGRSMWPAPAFVLGEIEPRLSVLQAFLKILAEIKSPLVYAMDKHDLSSAEVEFWQKRRPNLLLSGTASEGMIKVYADFVNSLDPTLSQRWHECPSDTALLIRNGLKAGADITIQAVEPLQWQYISPVLPFPRLPDTSVPR